ncbi:hypothetical protein K6119_16565 [Paracrocinitomix mangrovi]|uniref:hypothetical protein n=1 Tax=Paracrocinitomix mangrovi TaxID=2862509 RepID=UPI001C8D9099|nr:hypothetical protein [Paracrocinitomix mangrovi]UKN01341.1 hypothetical protein K6119_16565 [Paracrocinitomix mangrovi]
MKVTLTLAVTIILLSCSKHDNSYNSYYDKLIGDWSFVAVENNTYYTCPNKVDTSYISEANGIRRMKFEKRYWLRAYYNGEETSKSKTDFINVDGDINHFTFYIESEEYTGNFEYKNDTIRSEEELTYSDDEFCFTGNNEYGTISVYTRQVYVRI